MRSVSSPKRIAMLVLAVGISTTGAWSVAQTVHGGGHTHGAGHVHDKVNMPGLRGENATPQESAEIAALFKGFKTITREVENLPNGIKTITRSSDPAVSAALISHSLGMIDRVDQLDDPKIIIQSPTLDIFFLRGKAITSNIDITNDGLVVIQTSDDPAVIAALHTHAAEVTAMAERGMDAVHDMMTKRGMGH
ncbi:hypothetical protein ABMC88_15845 [Sulfitobacter sp. HNIBRBA2951]|uniref:hypothetical protein n=1 Tax=Sulfitobacter aquimarinus TaxID=3158557 RepID=UPI0032DE64B6